MKTKIPNRTKINANKKRVDTQIETLRRNLAKDIARILFQQQLTQTEASYRTLDAPSQISLVVSGKLDGFSIERLMRMRAMLDAALVLYVYDDYSPNIRLSQRIT